MQKFGKFLHRWHVKRPSANVEMASKSAGESAFLSVVHVHGCYGHWNPLSSSPCFSRLCKKRSGQFQKLRDAQKPEPFPEAAGFIVTHICLGDETMRHDFIPITRV